MSHGQRQRILIARVIYKNPDYLFFDEATNSLDAENEKIIVKHIDTYFKNKTKIRYFGLLAKKPIKLEPIKPAPPINKIFIIIDFIFV